MQSIKRLLPQYDYLFYGDIANMPYGDKTPEEIREYTFQWLKRLFDNGCKLVIIACNTAAAYSIRVRQATYPELKTLSVTIPGIEALIKKDVQSILFLSTTATRESGILPDLIYKHNYMWSIEIKACPWLADMIENDNINPMSEAQKREAILHCVWELKAESMMLACTHYWVRYDIFVSLFPDTIIIDPSQESANNLVDYLHRHSEIECLLTKGGTVEEYRTPIK
jgi:glutamate racemase